METLRECPQCLHPVNFKGLIADFECPNCHWTVEDEVLDTDGQGDMT